MNGLRLLRAIQPSSTISNVIELGMYLGCTYLRRYVRVSAFVEYFNLNFPRTQVLVKVERVEVLVMANEGKIRASANA
jgi:hypothetical protein